MRVKLGVRVASTQSYGDRSSLGISLEEVTLSRLTKGTKEKV